MDTCDLDPRPSDAQHALLGIHREGVPGFVLPNRQIATTYGCACHLWGSYDGDLPSRLLSTRKRINTKPALE